MEYTSSNFDRIIDRKGTNCIKYDFAKEYGKSEEILPLWVADMDFQTAEPVRERLIRIAEHGIYGYSEAKEDYFQAIQRWYERRFGWKTEKEWILGTPGVVFALSMSVRTFTKENDAILIQPPIYPPFRNVILNNNRTLVTNPLQLNERHYEIDFADFERKIKENHVKMFVLCSPHNPAGRVWREWELKKMVEICRKYEVLIVSDEIHSDFVFPGYRHRMLADVCSDCSDRIVTCTAPSKTFNLAGLQVSNIFISNPELREKFALEMRNIGYGHLNLMAMAACQAAYEEGDNWLDQLQMYLNGNLDYVRNFLAEYLPEIKLIEPEGTYLLWLDFRNLGLSEEALEELIVEKAALWLNSGTMFGSEGAGFERVNIACPRSILERAMRQLEQAVKSSFRFSAK